MGPDNINNDIILIVHDEGKENHFNKLNCSLNKIIVLFLFLLILIKRISLLSLMKEIELCKSLIE